MKTVLAAALVVSLAVIAWLLAKRPAPVIVEKTVEVPVAAAPPPPPPPRHAAGPRGESEVETLRARVAELETRLAAADEKAADLDAMDPLAFLMGAKKPIAWKAGRVLAIEPEKDRNLAAWKLGQSLGEKEGSAREILDALKAEKDPKVVAVLGEFLRAGAASKASADDRRAFADLLKSGATPDVRRACVRGVFMSEGFRGGGDEQTRSLAKEMNAALIDAVKTDSAPEVVGAIASAFADWQPPPEAMDALKDAGARLAPGAERRKVWEAIARGTFMTDAGASLVQQFDATTSQDLRDDIAAGIARAGNSMGGAVGGNKDDAKKRVEEARARFRSVFAKTGDVAVRRSLARAALYGMNCLSPLGVQSDEQKSDAARFFRDVAGLEPDPVQRDRFQRIATAFEVKGGAAYQDFDKINNGRD